ncbi:MAG: phosphate ABC transporter substrate-binding/OmpA family protein [Pseudomonadota bacterium]
MNRKLIGALLLFLISSIAIGLVWFFLPKVTDTFQKTTSDATKTKGKIVIAMDNWIGYFPLRSPEMKSLMRKAGWILVCEDDNADYDTRMRRLKDGDIDFAVATVDSYILNAKKYDFPGIIVSVIDESKGGDAILAVKTRVASLDAMKKKAGIRVAFTPNSPSHHLAKAAADHFNVSELLPTGDLRIETDGSEAARDKLLAGKADVAILWEPDVSRALAHEGIIKILGTEDTQRLIVDILVARRSLIKKSPELVKQILGNYFRALKKYKDNPELLREHIKDETQLPDDTVKAMLQGISWANFSDNCEQWFGIAAPGSYSDEGLIDTIHSTTGILMNSGDFSSNPIPGDDPYRLTNSVFLEELFGQGISGFTTPGSSPSGAGGIDSLGARFSPLEDGAWKALREVGTLKVDPIVFQQGTDELGLLARQVIDQAVERVRHYPNFRIRIKGHSGTRGDPDENLKLSQNRADAVMRYLVVVHGMDPNRLRSMGMGGTEPLARDADESKRSHDYRLPRVEMVLVRENY